MASTPFPLISCSNLPNRKLFLSTFTSSSSSVLRTSPYSSSCDPRRHLSSHSSSHSSSASAYGGGDDDLLRARVLASIPAAAPQAMIAFMRSAVAASPATIAPHVCAAACALLGCGGGGDRCGDAARAIALARAAFHAHVAGGGSPNVLAGDALLPLGFEILARALGGGSSERAHRAALRAVVEVAEAMGESGGAVGGHGMEAEGVGEEEAERVVKRTDGRMGECAAGCGAAAAAVEEGGDAAAEEVVGRVRRFGYYAGMMDGMLRRGAAEAAAEYKERAVAEVAGGGFDAAAAAAAQAMVEAWYEARVGVGLGGA